MSTFCKIGIFASLLMQGIIYIYMLDRTTVCQEILAYLLGIRASKVSGASAVHDLSTRSKAYFLAESKVEPLNGTRMIHSTP